MTPPTITTARLVLRPFGEDDVEALAPLHAEESFWYYPLRRGQTAEETATFVARQRARYADPGFGLCAVVEAASGELAGWAGLAVPDFLPEILPAVEVGWRLGGRFRGRGYATEAGAAWVRWGFESLGLDEIVSIHEPANVPSGAVMAKLGFEETARTTHPVSGIALRVTALPRWRWEASPVA